MTSNAEGGRASHDIECPHCGCPTVVISQMSFNTQSYSDEDDWGGCDYGDNCEDVAIGAKCQDCEADLTLYMLNKGWIFEHEVSIPNRSDQPCPDDEKERLPALRQSTADLDRSINEYTSLLGRLLDEKAKRARL